MKFEEWFKVYKPSLDTSVIESEFIYEAGASSRQTEIDEQFAANCKQTDHIHMLQRERDALQKRIDLALSAVWNDKCSHTVIDILKGDKND